MSCDALLKEMGEKAVYLKILILFISQNFGILILKCSAFSVISKCTVSTVFNTTVSEKKGTFLTNERQNVKTKSQSFDISKPKYS